MKQILTKTKELLFVVAMLLTVTGLQAQVPNSYKMYVTNEVQTAPNVYKFDVYLLNDASNGVPFKLTFVQFGLFLNSGIKNGGFIVPSIQAGSSELVSPAQTPTTVSFVNTVNYFNLAARPNPGNAGATTISTVKTGCTSPGTRVGTFIVTNQVSAGDPTPVPFAANSNSNSIWSISAASGRTNTLVNAYDQTTLNPVNITSTANHLALGGVNTCYQNLTLNFTCPTITVLPASGALGGGTIGTPYAGATVSASGGTAPYSYAVTAGSLPGGLTLSPSGNISGTPTGPAGTANFTVTATASGAGSCTGSASYSIDIVNGCAVTGVGTPTDESCAGTGDGSVSVLLSGTGSGAPGTYSLDGGPDQPYLTNPFTISGLGAGPHSVVATVTAGGCVSSAIGFTIGSPAAVTGSQTGGTDVSCNNGNDGTAQITLSSSTSGTYSLDGGLPVSYNSNPFTISGLTGGAHTVVATTSAGCVSNSIAVSVVNPAVFAGSVTGQTDVTCGGGGNNGTATITLTGGSTQAPGTYSLDGGPATPYASNPFTITSLSPGAHSVVVTAGGCSTIAIPMFINAPATFSATYVKTNISACNVGNDGTITITPVGGVAPYTYVWSGGYPGFAPGNVSAVTNLPIGFYNVTITDAGGCGIVTLTNIHIQFAFTVLVTNSGTSSSACGNTGSITLYGNAGILPYTYSITSASGPWQASNTFTGLAAGSYTGYVRDAAGCVGQKPITVSAAPAIVVNPFARSASSCAPDGSIEIYRTGGTPPFSYSITSASGPWQTSNTFTGLAAGSYTAYVKDGQNCVGSAAATVAQGVGLTVTTQRVPTSTCVNDGTIQVNVTGGIAPYTYSIDGGTTFQASNSFTGLTNTTYAVVAKDSKGCLGNASATINLNPIVVTSFVVNAPSCAGTGSIQLFRTGGVGPYTYSLDGNTYQASNLFTGVAPGTYIGYVKDSKTCIGQLANIVVGPTGCLPPPITMTKGITVEVPAVTSMKVQAYPNPSTTSFTLQLEGYNMNEKVSVTVTDVLGRKVYQTEGTGKQQYSFGSKFIAGMYNVQVLQGSDKKSLKVVKE